MKFISQIKSIRCCQICGTFGVPFGVCGSCIREIRVRVPQKLLSRQEDGLSSYSLFVWDDHEDPWVRSVVYSQKGVTDPLRWRHWANWYIERVLLEESRMTLPRFLIVPPARNKNGTDHATGWAQALADNIGARVISPFQLEGDSIQKRLSLVGRDMRRFKVRNAREIDVFKGQPYVFVDDVITSGATGKAAFFALGCPKDFTIWTLFDRPKLYGLRDGSASANFRA